MLQQNCCSLLENPNSYKPDTFDLSTDPEAADYWFECFQEIAEKFATQAARSQRYDPTAEKRAQDFKEEYLKLMENLRSSQSQTQPLTIRLLLELNEVCLKQYGFNDPWLEQKKLENEASISLFKSRTKEIDRLDVQERWTELIRGVLAGNIFDWGAQAVSEILQSKQQFGLYEALEKIEKRPWLIDDLDKWLQRLAGPPHKCAAIFVDNSGVDIILGILPFARELLKRRTKVIFCANTEPSLNDVTLSELNAILYECSCQCEVFHEARKNDQILTYGNGQKGPCLDMRNLSEDLCNAIDSNETDLLVIEGMGRALHTNLYAKFRCETLKLAVVKNKWLANRLGGDTFAVICKYENISST